MTDKWQEWVIFWLVTATAVAAGAFAALALWSVVTPA